MAVEVVDRPATSTAEMGITEAKGITLAIKENFNSLGGMIVEARDRKAYKALGYRSFESYCNAEFGKSISSAYQLIEDTKIIAQLEAEISKQSEKPITLSITSSHLKPLKQLPQIADKLKAITFAQELAKERGEKPSRKHLELGVFEITGKRAEDFKASVESLGFTKGTPIEIERSLKRQHGFISRVDKRGKISVELYDGGSTTILCDYTELRVLEDSEKPGVAASDFTARKGDKVRIFAKGLEGKIGEIYAWKMGKHAMILVDRETVPSTIAYAQLELLAGIPTKRDWDTNLSWTNNGNTYYFDSVADTIICDKWPSGLRLSPHHSEDMGPAEWIEKWENHHTVGLLESLINPSAFKRLALTLAIKLPEEKKNEFVSDLIAGLVRLLPSQFKLEASSPNTAEIESLQAENQRLREQLAEAESAIESIVDMSREQIEILPEVEQTAEFLVEDTDSADSPLGAEESVEFLVEDDWRSILKFNHFCSIEPDDRGDFIEEYRNWSISFCSPNGGIIAIDLIRTTSPEEMFTYCTEEKFHVPLDDFEDNLAWTKTIINQIEDFCPGQLSLNLNPEIELFPQEMVDRVAVEREKIFQAIEDIEIKKAGKTNKQRANRIKKDLEALKNRLEGIKKFEQLKIGQKVWHKSSHQVTGEIVGFTFTTGGMPHIFVRWNHEEEGAPSFISPEIISSFLISQPEL